MDRMCVIAARGGSKGLPGKNLRLLQGRPLVAHSILQALESGIFKEVVATSDDDDILAVAEREGASVVKRPAYLASDEAGKLPTIVHALLETEIRRGCVFETVTDLDVTSPLRSVAAISEAVYLLESRGLQSVFSASVSRKSPYFNIAQKRGENWGPAVSLDPYPLRRQDAPLTYDMNGSIYVWNRHALVQHQRVFLDKTEVYVMPESESWDIDTELDFEIVSLLMARRHKAH